MGKASRAKWERRLEVRLQTALQTKRESGVLAFLEHGWMAAIFGILFSFVGTAVALVWAPAVAILGVVACGAFYRVGVVKGKPLRIQTLSYLGVLTFLSLISYGCILIVRIYAHIPTLQEISQAVWNGHTSQAQTTIINNYQKASPTPAPAETLKQLKQNTNALASQLLDFVYAREGPINGWRQQAIAQSFADAIRNQNNGNEFETRLNEWNAQTNQEFASYYWPKVQSLTGELETSGIDVSPISRAVASDSPRKVALMLSVLADRIGKQQPYSRVLTPIEARAIMQGFGGVGMEIYAYTGDTNSIQVAETLRKEFAKEKWNVNTKVLPLREATKMPSGVHIVFPSRDLTVNFEGMIEAFKFCELETVVDVVDAVQPPTILKIEVWPQKQETVTAGPNLIR